MKYGYIKTALCSPELRNGAIAFNSDKIKETVSAAAKKAEIIVFGENAVTGGSVGGMSGYDAVVNAANKAVSEIAAHSKTHQSLVIVGFPARTADGTVSAAALIHGGKICAVAVNSDGNGAQGYTVVDGESVPVSACGTFFLPAFGTTLSVCFGEDFDNVVPAEIIINLSDGAPLIGSLSERANAVKVLSDRLICGYAYVSDCGEKTVADCGETLASSYESEEITYAEIDADAIKKARSLAGNCVQNDSYVAAEIPLKSKNADVTRNINPLPFVPENGEFARILDIMGNAVYSRMTAARVKRVIFGLSGGLDSTMVLVACEKLFARKNIDRKNIIAVTMSGFGSSDRTKNNAKELIEAMGVTNIDIPIADAVTNHLKAIGHGGKKDIVYENAQARERAQILLDLSNAHDALLLGTGDLSEIALGWSTYGGDQLAQFNPNSSATKTLIRAVMRNYCLTSSNATAAEIINDVLATPVSPELIPGQVTEDVLGPYELHDFFLYNLIGKGFSAEKTVYLAQKAYPDFTRKTVIKHLQTFVKRFFANQFKRNASCDGVALCKFDLSRKTISSEFSGEQFIAEAEKLLEKQ